MKMCNVLCECARVLAVACAFSSMLTGIAQVPAQNLSAVSASADVSEYRLQSSDTVDISLPFSPEYNQTVTIQPDGLISLKEAAPVKALGVTLNDLDRLVAEAYNGVLRDPKVYVTLKEFQKPSFYVNGEVNRPGRYELRTSTTLMQAISEAGGLAADRAKRTKIVIFRPVKGGYEPTVFDLKAVLNVHHTTSGFVSRDYPIQSGDIVFVPQNKFSKFARFIPTSSLGATVVPAY